jgi:two-component system cell cycle sensor histidine kinase/response regulator CckA
VNTGRESRVAAFVKATFDRIKGNPPRTLNVLIVDDEAQICHFVERVVQRAGHATMTARSGAEALAAAASADSVDLLITDLMMPQMNGDELARRMLVLRPKLKVLYLTGFSEQLFKDKVALWQDEAFLEKPCSVKGLMEAVSLLLFGRVESPQLAR